MAEPVRLVELRTLDGPNLYYTRPAMKVTLSVPGWLSATERRLDAIATRWGLSGTSRPGMPGSEQRLRFVSRVAMHAIRRLAEATRTRLAVRARPGGEPDQIVVAYPWRRRGAAEALGSEIAALLDAMLQGRRSRERMLVDAARRMERIEPGARPAVPDPTIPVIAVTGTNGKTTTVRLLAHLVRSAGLSVAYSSTDGVYRDDELVEEGDYSGFGGAARALAQPAIDVAVLETARGGILLRGIGTLHNDVAVVTNVSEDHLGMHGIRTLDQLAEVKATITKITRRSGWDVLNADDPRVLAMRRGARGRPWLFSLDPNHPAIRETLADGGRAITVLDGSLVVLAPGADPRPLAPLIDVPVTIAGISSHNIQNAMAAAAAALGAGLSEEAVVRGLRTFVLDPESNPGRANLFTLDGRVVLVDFAHNEAGMVGLTEMCAALRRRGRKIWLAFGTAGDRSDEILHALGYRAARGADHVAVAELKRYLRGRRRGDIIDRMRAGAIDGGADKVPSFRDEVAALQWMIASSRRGDVVAITALAQRPEVFALLRREGGVRLGPTGTRRLVSSIRASHEPRPRVTRWSGV